jgi:VIT1/CCC1 family predicted Fe2+/Mn2+ transporter
MARWKYASKKELRSMADAPQPGSPSAAALGEFIERQNERLRASASANAEIAFGIGCLLGVAPPVIVVALLFMFKLVSLILAAILGIIALLVAAGLAMLFSYTARANTMKKSYRAQVEPEITEFLAQNEINQLQFSEAAHDILPPDAPLRAFIRPPAAQESE